MITIILLFLIITSASTTDITGYLIFLPAVVAFDVGMFIMVKVSAKQQTVTTRRRTTRRTTPKTTYSTTRVTKVATPKTHGITTTSTTQKRCPNCGCYVHVSANGAYECGYCANYYGGNK